jgi:hypothetical protein
MMQQEAAMLAKRTDPDPVRTAGANDGVRRALEATRKLGDELRRNGNGKTLAHAMSKTPVPEVPRADDTVKIG